MAEAYTYAAQSVNRLLDEYPDIAASILARCYRTDKEVKNEIDSHLQSSGPGNSQALRAPSNSAIPISSNGSMRGYKPSPRSQLAPTPHHHRGTMKSNAAPTPPGSSSARSSKGSPASSEMILLVDNYEANINELPVFLQKAATLNISLIREDIVNERMMGAEPEEDGRIIIVLPDTVVPQGACAEVQLSESVLLTWRRKKSDSTHRTKFFLVPKLALSTDVVLGREDSGEGNSGSPDPGTARHLYRRGNQDADYQQEVQSPTVVPLSFHRSQNAPGPYQTGSLHQFNQDSMEGYQVHQAQHGLNEERQQPVQPPPISTSLRPPSTQSGHIRLAPPPVQTPSRNSETPNRRLRLSLKWDKTPLNLWLYPDSSAEVFFQALRDVSKHRQVPNWNSWVIWLKTESQSPDESAYRLTLGEDLDADWETTVDWLEQNKRDKPPHICGTFEFDEGR